MSNVAITPGVGATIGTDTVAGVDIQKLKVDVGTTGNSVLWGSSALADGTAIPTVPLIGAFGHLFNGTTYDRARSAQGAVDATTGLGLSSSAGYRFNGATWDREYGNIPTTLLASAARTTAQTTAQQGNFNGRGVVIALNVTAASGTGGLTVRVQGVDAVSSTAYSINTAPTAVIATGITTYTVYPGVSAGFTQSTSGVLPRLWQVLVSVGDASSYTYSVGSSLIL